MPNAKHSAQRAADGIHAQQRWEVANDAARLALATGANPPLVRGGVCLQDDGAIWDLIQVEPSIIWQRRPTNAELSQIAYSSDHGSLNGLGDDDHPQYLLASGARQLTGNLVVVPGVTIDGRDISVDGATLDGHTTAIASKADASALTGHTGNTSNPHSTTAAQVGAVPTGRTVTAGAGLTGGGALTGDLTLNVGAHADGSIVVADDTVQVGTLATDGQHGTRGGGMQHAAAVAGGAAGFITGASQQKLDDLPTVSALTSSFAGKADASALTSHTGNSSNPHGVTAAQAGAVPTGRTVSTTAPLTGGGALSGDLTLAISAATTSDPGSMSAADKTKLDALPTNAALTALFAGKQGFSMTASATTLAAASSVIVCENPAGTQTGVAFTFNNVVRGGIRTDSSGNFAWLGASAHQFYGSLDTSVPIAHFSANGVVTGAGAGGPANAQLESISRATGRVTLRAKAIASQTADAFQVESSGATADLFKVDAAGLFSASRADGLTASATQTQGQVPLTKNVNRFSTVASANNATTLPAIPSLTSPFVVVVNDGANTLQVFPASGASIDAGAANASTTIAAGSKALLVAVSATKWVKLDDASSKANRRLLPNSQSGTTYTLVQGDEDTGVETTNSSAVTITAPQLAAGTQIPVYQMGAGKVTIAAGSGVTLRAPLGAKTLQQYTPILLWWRSATEVVISGTTSVS